jgi:pyruvate dehydrogenase E1 component beta subunit
MSIVEALRQGIREEMQRDPTVFCIGEDIGIPGGFGGAFTVTLGLSDEFGHDRILDTPISELGLTGVAVGAALAGLRPIADVQYSDFLFLAMDQLVNQAAKMCYMSGGTVKVPLVMRAPVGATARGAQHAQSRLIEYLTVCDHRAIHFLAVKSEVFWKKLHDRRPDASAQLFLR